MLWNILTSAKEVQSFEFLKKPCQVDEVATNTIRKFKKKNSEVMISIEPKEELTS